MRSGRVSTVFTSDRTSEGVRWRRCRRGWPRATTARRAGLGPGRARCRGRSPRPGRRCTGRRRASAVSWQSRSFCEPPPTMWTTSTRWPASSAAWSTVRRVGGGERVDDAADSLGRRQAAARPAARRRSVSGMSPGAMKAGIVDVDRRATGGRAAAAGAAGRRGHGRRPRPRRAAHSCRSQRPPTLRRNRVRPSTPRSLVKFACAGGLGEDGRLELEADERPGAAGDVGEPVGGRGHGDDGRRGVVRADGGDDGRRRRTSRAANGSRATASAGSSRARGCRGARAASVDHCRRPDVEQAGRRRVGHLGPQRAGQPVGEEVGEQHDMRRSAPTAGRARSAASW